MFEIAATRSKSLDVVLLKLSGSDEDSGRLNQLINFFYFCHNSHNKRKTS